MSKKDFIKLADYIRDNNKFADHSKHFNQSQLECLANFCASQNPRFMRHRWFAYIKGECGPNGGAIKKPKI